LLVVVATRSSIASEGDELPEFISCVNSTIAAQCSSSTAQQQQQQPLYLRLTLWTCEDNCRYNCMHSVTDARPGPMYQFYGKWPFYRLWGIQEPASVAFSLGNLYMHYHYLRMLAKEIPTKYYLRPFILGYAAVNINTWIQSTIFHTRDLPFTEKLDYFSAAMSILYSVYYATLRIFQIDDRRKQLLLGGVLLGLFATHMFFMSFVAFNYVYNMIICGIFAVLQGAMWVMWYFVVGYLRQNKRVLSYGHWVLYATGANALTVMLEVFDFPPIGRVFDAHSLWHLSTIFVAPLWYHFVILDS
ncbi:Per1-like protein, partial [Zychaea mexicana]|uniref:Per1-like protein n=1 Tax=Zychaea mexicana TaxID=64656 RepID=UPI0022FEB22D